MIFLYYVKSSYYHDNIQYYLSQADTRYGPIPNMCAVFYLDSKNLNKQIYIS